MNIPTLITTETLVLAKFTDAIDKLASTTYILKFELFRIIKSCHRI